MTDIQILTIAIAVVVPLGMLIYSNSKVSDAKETLRAEMRALHAETMTEFKDLKNSLKMHELERCK